MASVLTPLSVVAVIWLARERGDTWLYWVLLLVVVAHAGQAWLIWVSAAALEFMIDHVRSNGSARKRRCQRPKSFWSAPAECAVPGMV
jgi:hypothetical protein